MKSEKTLFHKFMEYAIGSGLSIIIGLVTSPIITRLIYPSEYGKFSMFNLFTSIISIFLTFGLDQSYVRFYYEEIEENRSELLRQTIKIPLLVSILFSMALLLFRKQLSLYLFNEYNILAIIVMIINTIIFILNRYSCLTIRLEQNGKLYSCIQVIQKISSILLFLMLFYSIGNTYNVLILSTVCSSIFVTCISIYKYKNIWFRKSHEQIKLKNSNKKMVLYGFPLMCTSILYWIFQSIDKIFIKNYCNYIEVGLYASAFSIITLLNHIQNTFLNFWIPVAYEHYENNRDDKKFFIRIFNNVAVSMFLIAIFTITFKDIIILLLGSEYRKASYIMPFLVLMPLMNTVSEVSVMGIGFKKKAKYHIYITIICCIFNVLGNYLIIPYLNAKGAAITTGLTYILFFSLRTIISQKFFKVDYDLTKFYIVTILLCIFCIYGMINKFSLMGVLIGMLLSTIVIYLYIEEVKRFFGKVKRIVNLHKIQI